MVINHFLSSHFHQSPIVTEVNQPTTQSSQQRELKVSNIRRGISLNRLNPYQGRASEKSPG